MTLFDQLATERPNPRTTDIDRLDTLGILERLNAEDQQVAAAVRPALPDLARAVDLALEHWQRGGRIVLFGAGTSGRLAMLDAAELGPTFGVPPDRYTARLAGGSGAFVTAVEGAEDDVEAGARAAGDLQSVDVAVGDCRQWAHAVGARRVASSARAWGGERWRGVRARAGIGADGGRGDRRRHRPEPIAGSTRMKAGTAQKLVLNAFSSTLMIRLGKVYGNLMVDVRATNEKLRRRAARLVEVSTGVDTDAAEDALRQCDGEVKTAIAMLRLGISPGSARERLEAASGRLRVVLGETWNAAMLRSVTLDWAVVRGLMIDLDGVVYMGREPIAGAAGFLSEARRRGLPFLLVTNNSTTSPELVAERLSGMHIDVEPNEILTSAQAAVAYVRAHSEGKTRVRVIGEAGLRQAAEAEGLEVFEDGEAHVDWVVAGLDRAFDYHKLTAATRDILGGARFLATNADALLPVEGGNVLPGAGSIVGAIQIATAVDPIVVGKPEPGLFEHGLRRLGDMQPGEVAMIGDRLDTDVVGARRAGLRSVLVLSGVTTAQHVAESTIEADLVVADLASVSRALGWT